MCGPKSASESRHVCNGNTHTCVVIQNVMYTLNNVFIIHDYMCIVCVQTLSVSVCATVYSV